MTSEAIKEAARDLETASAADIVRWAADRFAPRLTFATSLGIEDCLVTDLIARAKLPVDLFTLDTELLFPETYALWKRIEEKYGVTIKAVKPARTVAEQASAEGPALWTREPDRCCDLRKMRPLGATLANYDAWITAIRRDQTPERANAPVVGWDGRFGLVKINPLVRWTSDQVRAYVAEHEVPYNPLHDRNYPSIGCMPCTSPVMPGEDSRSGRWRGQEKTECGLHLRIPVRAES
ncbi:MAG: phosphoadenosine phosphosulfate reductase [Acidobacteria bacterium RIFCSPLOWO2_02_FULL_65_29]|nr:MAG: phosphoadenosine phosphosulfate reductase [Acidobacteria bacterium RIFCSPLOWO2_02_FULL_65_29]